MQAGMYVGATLLSATLLQSLPVTVQAQAAAAPQVAASGQAEVKYVTSAPSSAKNFMGDRIRYGAVLQAHSLVLGSNKADAACVPANTEMIGIGTASLRLGDQDMKEHALFTVTKQSDETGLCGGMPAVKLGQSVAVDTLTLEKTPPNRSGLTYGTLIVPYKYQVRGDRSVAGGATLGGYLGYRATVFGSSLAFIGFAGPTKVDVAKVTGGKPVTESLAGLSYGIGALGSVKDGFKAGVVIGADRVARSAGYPNNGKAWISLSLGYDFTAN